VFAAVARSGIQKDGNAVLGHALRLAYENDRGSEPAKGKLRRLLACTTVEEVCDQLHSLLKFISGKINTLSYSELLSDLIKFQFSQDRVKAKWAQSFFGKTSEDKETEE